LTKILSWGIEKIISRGYF